MGASSITTISISIAITITITITSRLPSPRRPVPRPSHRSWTEKWSAARLEWERHPGGESPQEAKSGVRSSDQLWFPHKEASAWGQWRAPPPQKLTSENPTSAAPRAPPNTMLESYGKQIRSAVEHWARGARGAAAEVKFLRGVYTILFALCFCRGRNGLRRAGPQLGGTTRNGKQGKAHLEALAALARFCPSRGLLKPRSRHPANHLSPCRGA